VNNIAIDDAYHWEDKSVYSTANSVSKPVVKSETTPTEASVESVESAEPVQTVSTGPAIEYLHVEDTTITVRIRR